MCALGYVCITPCENSWGRGSGLLTNQLYRPSRERIAPALRLRLSVDGGGCEYENHATRFRSISKKCHCGQAGAVVEGAVPDAGDAIRNRDARQAATVKEGAMPNSGKLTVFPDPYIRQAGAAREGVFSDTGDRLALNSLRNNELPRGPFLTTSYCYGVRIAR